LGKAIRLVNINSPRNSNEFDWYQNWTSLRDIISQYIKYDSKILNVGAGKANIIKEIPPSVKKCMQRAIKISPTLISHKS
jgi:hypothetical protein